MIYASGGGPCRRGRRALSEAAAVSGAASVLERWGVGDRRNNGVALVLAVDDRKVAIKTGEGAKALLTDAEVQSIIVKMRPFLRGGDYAGAVLAAVGGIVDELRGVGGASATATTGGGYLEDLARLSVPVGIFGAFSFFSHWRNRHAAAATLRRIDTAYATATPSAALARPDAGGPHCDVCLRCPPDVPKVQCQPMACGHAVCQACRWRFGATADADAGAEGAPALADGVPDLCGGVSRGVAVRGGGGGVQPAPRRRRRRADGVVGRFCAWELRMRSHCMSHGFRRAYGNPEWVASPTALAEKPGSPRRRESCCAPRRPTRSRRRRCRRSGRRRAIGAPSKRLWRPTRARRGPT